MTKQRWGVEIERQRRQHVGIEQASEFLFARLFQRVGHVRLAFTFSGVGLRFFFTAGRDHLGCVKMHVSNWNTKKPVSSTFLK